MRLPFVLQRKVAGAGDPTPGSPTLSSGFLPLLGAGTLLPLPA